MKNNKSGNKNKTSTSGFLANKQRLLFVISITTAVIILLIPGHLFFYSGLLTLMGMGAMITGFKRLFRDRKYLTGALVTASGIIVLWFSGGMLLDSLTLIESAKQGLTIKQFPTNLSRGLFFIVVGFVFIWSAYSISKDKYFRKRTGPTIFIFSLGIIALSALSMLEGIRSLNNSFYGETASIIGTVIQTDINLSSSLRPVGYTLYLDVDDQPKKFKINYKMYKLSTPGRYLEITYYPNDSSVKSIKFIY